jgi:hypothetical protein
MGTAMIVLTRPDGSKIEVRKDAVSLVSPDRSSFMGGNSIVRIDGENHGVMEMPDEIEKLLA